MNGFCARSISLSRFNGLKIFHVKLLVAQDHFPVPLLFILFQSHNHNVQKVGSIDIYSLPVILELVVECTVIIGAHMRILGEVAPVPKSFPGGVSISICSQDLPDDRRLV